MKPSENLSAQQSLEIITSMIHQAKGNVQQNSFYFLLWGWVVALANLGMFILSLQEYRHPYIVWIITIPAWIYTLYRGYKQERTQRVSSPFDRISGALWICYGVCVFTLVIFGYKINFQLNPVILIVSSIPTFVSGTIVRFKPLMMGGILFWLFGIVSFLVPVYIQSLVGAVAIIGGYLIPGYLLSNKTDK
ncbi:MAG TPA: hypothetical protein VIN08_17445 [Ohtaekwangia sp.]|uniref:hypothetical protein n=1 Tax=Ohtaekwangia sp. TaxID=2066019 RepID=UPI002F95C857